MILTALVFNGCSKYDGVVAAASVVNKYNPDLASKEALNAYGNVRKVVRAEQDAKKSDVNTSIVLIK